MMTLLLVNNGVFSGKGKDLLSRWWCLLFIAGLFLSGCDDFFRKKPTEIESRAILNELGRVRENPHVKNLLPQVYRSPSQRMVAEGGVKVFYFCQHTPAATLADNVKQLGFNVSRNPSTNQLIIHCPDNEQADRVLDYLNRVDVAPIQVNVDCLILERFGDVTKDWESTMLVENLFGTGLTLGASKYPKPVFPGASLRESTRSNFGLDIGYWLNKGKEGHQVRLAIDALVSRGYLKILMNPTLETVNGKAAKVEIRDYAPIPKIVTSSSDSTVDRILTDYKWVADSLEVTPYVYADGAIGLKTSIVIGSKSKPEGVTQTSIITERSIQVAENRIEPGKSLVIGGMRKSENRSVVRGVPFLKDIPIIGIFFSSKDFEEKATEIIFILTPSVSSGGQEYSQVASDIRQKYRPVEPENDFMHALSDPFGVDAYIRKISRQVSGASVEKIKAQREALEAERQAQVQRQRAEQARQEAEALKDKARRVMEEVDCARADIAKAQEAAKQARQQTAEEQQRIETFQRDMQVLRQEMEQATQEAQTANEQARQAEQKASELEKQAQAAQEEARLARQQIEQMEAQIKSIEASEQAVQDANAVDNTRQEQ